MLTSELDNTGMEIPVSEIPPGPSGIKTEPKEDCEDLLSAFLMDPPPVKIENNEISYEYGTLSKDYTVDVKKLKTEHSEDNKEWLNNPLIKNEKNNELAVSEDRDDDFTEDSNIKSEEMHIKEDDGINEPGLSSNSCLPNNEDNAEDGCTPTTKPEFHCHKCQYKTIVKCNLKRHLLSKHKTLKCNECSFETDCKHILDDHLIRHASRGATSATFSCHQCTFETRKERCLKAHLRHYCMKGELYRCDKCEFETKFKYRLKDHFLVHKEQKDEEMFKCLECEYKTYRKNKLKEHLQRRHGKPNDVTSYKCEYLKCHFKTQVKDQLEKHILRHSDGGDLTPYQCSNCSYKTYRKHNFQDHLLRHDKSKAVAGYQCIHCSYKTAIMKDLKKHFRNHDHEKLIKCPKCLYKTHRKWNLKKHLIRRHGEPEVLVLYECSHCPYQTCRKKDFNNHLLQHTK